jgi:hypothetical protein
MLVSKKEYYRVKHVNLQSLTRHAYIRLKPLNSRCSYNYRAYTVSQYLILDAMSLETRAMFIASAVGRGRYNFLVFSQWRTGSLYSNLIRERYRLTVLVIGSWLSIPSFVCKFIAKLGYNRGSSSVSISRIIIRSTQINYGKNHDMLGSSTDNNFSKFN